MNSRSLLIVMAGLPGTGKSTLAAKLAERLGGVVLSKDIVRAEMFSQVDYSRDQDDAALAEIYRRAQQYLAWGQPVLIDGRTFSKAYQVRDLLAAAEAVGQPLRVIECICADDVVEQRLHRDLVSGNHPAGNRTVELHRQVKAEAEPLTIARLVLDTGILSVEECLHQAVEYIAR